MASYTGEVFQAYSNVAFLLKKDERFYGKSMKGIVVTMPVQSPWWLKLFVMGSIG